MIDSQPLRGRCAATRRRRTPNERSRPRILLASQLAPVSAKISRARPNASTVRCVTCAPLRHRCRATRARGLDRRLPAPGARATTSRGAERRGRLTKHDPTDIARRHHLSLVAPMKCHFPHAMQEFEDAMSRSDSWSRRPVPHGRNHRRNGRIRSLYPSGIPVLRLRGDASHPEDEGGRWRDLA